MDTGGVKGALDEMYQKRSRCWGRAPRQVVPPRVGGNAWRMTKNEQAWGNQGKMLHKSYPRVSHIH